MLAGGVSVVATLIAAYLLATADSDPGLWLSLVGLILGLAAAGVIASAAHDWREATARIESHMPLLRSHGQRLREARSPEAMSQAEKLLEHAHHEREMLVQAGAHRQAAEMTAAIADLEAAMNPAP